MKAFLDTTVLVASFCDEHQHHKPSFELFLQLDKRNACTAAHSLAEFYAVLTGMPGQNRATPQEAMLFLSDVRERLTIITLSDEAYFRLLEDASALGIVGGAIYDAVLARCALQAGVEIIYSWNDKHFSRLGPDVASRVKAPGSN